MVWEEWGTIKSPFPHHSNPYSLALDIYIYITDVRGFCPGLLFVNNTTSIPNLKHDSEFFVDILNVTSHGFQPHLEFFRKI